MIKNCLYIIFIFLVFNIEIKAQNLYYPLGNSFLKDINFIALSSEKPINTAFKPLMQSEFNINSDSIIYQFSREEKLFSNHKKTLVLRKLFTEDFFVYKKNDFSVSVNPLFYIEKGYDSTSIEKLFVNTRGIEIKGNLGKKISFYSAFYENQAYYQAYINKFVNVRKVVPGQGASKGYFTNKQDFSMSAGYLSYSPAKWINIQTGSDKNFIGEGYRSLLLSDNSFNYPFLKTSFFYKSFKYTAMFTEFQDFSGVYYSYHFKKHGTFNLLSYSFKNKIEIDFFEGVIYKTEDTTLHFHNKFPADFFIPIPGVRTAINGYSNENKVVTGINLKGNITKNIQIYFQIASDNPKKKKFAFQIGVKTFDLFFNKLKNQKLYFQAEYNFAKNGIYSNIFDTLQTWTHYNQELAHPYGTDFSEILININYSFLNFYIDFKYIDANLNRQNTFSDIYNYNNFNYIYVNNSSVNHKTIVAGWIFNPQTKLQIYAGADIRNSFFTSNTKTNYYFFGLKTSLNNFYFDF